MRKIIAYKDAFAEMKSKILNIGLVLASAMGYLEWGGGNSAFLAQGEIEVISKLFKGHYSVLHPLVLLPLAGQVLLIITLFQRSPSRLLTMLGLAGLGTLIGFMFIIGVISANIRIVLSTVPFLVIGFLVLKHNRDTKPARKE